MNSSEIFNKLNHNHNKSNNYINSKEKLPILPVNSSAKTNNNNKYYSLIIGILCPIIFIIFIFLIIYYLIRRRKKLIIKSTKNNEKKINYKNPGLKLSYKKIQNSSNLNILNTNNISMSEIKIQNFQNDINNMLNGPGNSSSSRKRKRGKNIIDNTNLREQQEKQKEVQNEIKEEIKKYVIGENANK